MRRVGYWTFLALSVAVAVLAISLGLMRLIEGEMLYAISNTVGVLALAALLYGGAYYFKGSGEDSPAAAPDSAEDDHGSDDGSADAADEADGARPHTSQAEEPEAGDGERVDHIDQAAEASEAEEDGQTV